MGVFNLELIILLQLIWNASGSTLACNGEINCLKCGLNGCIKCQNFITIDTRHCVDHCPNGYIAQWSQSHEIMGRVCRPSSFSGSVMATLVGITVGALICLLIIILGVVVMRKRFARRHMREALIEDTIERGEFLKQLDELRPNSEYFLIMLNDTRRQIRKLHKSGDVTAADSYRSLVRDLAKILILLNRPVEVIQPPHDWNQLYSWTDQILEKYKPPVGELIDFLQAPPTAPPDPRYGTCQHNTFKGSAPKIRSNLSSVNQIQLLGSLISLHDLDQPKASDLFRNSFNGSKTEQRLSGCWLEDEFFKLGFRPQDEITTEL